MVSVIVRSMDRPTLPRALASIAAQDYPSIEVVLVAACGAAHAPVDASGYPFRLNMVTPSERLTRAPAANAGLDAATGKWVTFLDDDDEFLAGHVSGLVRALSETPGARAAYCRFEFFEHGKRLAVMGKPFNRIALYESPFMHLSALLFERSLLANGVRFDPALSVLEDWDFAIQVSEVTPFVFVPQTTFRWYSDAGSSGVGGLGNFDPNNFSVFKSVVREKWAEHYNALVQSFNDAVERGLAAAQQGRLDDAADTLGQALEQSPDDADVLNLLAMVKHQQGDFLRARELIGQAVSVRPDDPRLLFNQGLVAAAQKESGAARTAFEKVLALQPDHPGAKKWLAQLAA
jgi:tetratricopeptide (TPR) repeat protein